MGPRLHWHLGPGEGEAVAVPVPERIVPARTQRRVALTPPMVALYLAALACAGGIGFGIGRWSQARSAIAGEIGRQVTLETVAWREADAGLLEATLDPTADPAWRAVRLDRMRSSAPVADYAATVQSITVVRPGLAHVTVYVETGDGSAVDDRLYRALGPAWYHTAPANYGAGERP